MFRAQMLPRAVPLFTIIIVLTVAGLATSFKLACAGEKLPEGAVARLGTDELRALCSSIHFSANGKTLVGVDGGCLIRAWDAASGSLVETRRFSQAPFRDQWAIRTARSADGRSLLIAAHSAWELWDIPSGKLLDVPLPKGRKAIRAAALSDDRRLLLLSEVGMTRPLPPGQRGSFSIDEQLYNLLLWNTATGTLRVLGENESHPLNIAVSPDGKWLAASSNGIGTRVWDGGTGRLAWTDPWADSVGLTFTRGGGQLIAAPNSNQPWRIWDTATGKPAIGFEPPSAGYPQAWEFAVSPDGSKLIMHRGDYILWDLRKGKVLHRWPGPNRAGRAVFSPDSQSVVTYDSILRRWDVNNGKLLYRDVSLLGHTRPVHRLLFTPDGRSLVSIGEDSTIRTWDVKKAASIYTIHFTATNNRSWSFDPRPDSANYDGWALTPDGATLIGVEDPLTVHQWSTADGQQRQTCQLTAAADLNIRLQVMHARVLPDLKTLVVAAWPMSGQYDYRKYSFSFWDLSTGRQLRWGAEPTREYRGGQSWLSADGRYTEDSGKIFDTRTGEAIPMDGMGQFSYGGLISPDGRLLAAGHRNGVRVGEIATGQLVIDLPGASTYWAAFAPNARRFGCTDGRRVRVWDLETGKILLDRPGPEYFMREVNWIGTRIAFSQDGGMVATGHRDGTIYLWSVPPVERKQPLTERDLSQLWDELASNDAGLAYRAIWRYVDEPKLAVAFLDRHLPPVTLPSDVQWRTIIQDLDSDRFALRESASRHLERLGRLVEGSLRQAMKDNLTAEQRRRIAAALALLEPPRRPSADDLRAVRAVAILEGINTAEARQVLQRCTKRLPGEWLTEEATNAEARLKWRPAARLE